MPIKTTRQTKPAPMKTVVRKRAGIDFEFLGRERTRRADRQIASCKCKDCGVNVIKSGEYYMVTPSIWQDKLHMQWNDNLCIGCLEDRLGRKLRIRNFITFPPNPIGGTSERYHRQLVGDQQYERDIAKLRSKAKRKRAASLTCAALAIMLLLAPTAAQAQQSRTIYGSDGRVSGRTHTDSQCSTTIYDASGRVTGRTSTSSSGTTTFYGADGRKIGTVTTQPEAGGAVMTGRRGRLEGSGGEFWEFPLDSGEDVVTRKRKPSVASVIRQMQRAGVEIVGCEINPRDGTIKVVSGKPSEATTPDDNNNNNEWDSVLQ